MALRIRKGLPPFVPVKLGGDAVIRLRSATSDEIEAAASTIGFQVVAILQGAAEAEALRAMLPGFDFGDLAALAGAPRAEVRDLMAQIGIRSRIERLQDRLLLIELVAVCSDGWSGLVDDETGAELALDRGAIALVLADPTISARCRKVVYAAVHAEDSEGNALAASPAGEAAIPASAQTAEQPANAAPTA